MRGCIPYHIKGLLIRSLTGEALNTKTKLDLTKLFYSWSFTTPFLFIAKVNTYFNSYKENRLIDSFYR